MKAKRHEIAMSKLGERIRRSAAARGLSLRQIEQRAGLGPNLWRILSGRRKPHGRTLLKIGRVVGVGALTAGRARIEGRLLNGGSSAEL